MVISGVKVAAGLQGGRQGGAEGWAGQRAHGLTLDGLTWPPTGGWVWTRMC